MTDATGSATGQSNVSAVGAQSGVSSGTASGSSVVSARSGTIETYDSQLAALTDAAFDLSVRAEQLAALTMGTQRADFLEGSQLLVKALTQITAEEEYASQLAVKTVGANDMTDINTSQLAVLTLVRSNPDRRKMRAWSFVQDGHWFYVLHLGNTTTLVFDTLTRKWSEWQTHNMNNWRANYGVNWNGDVLAGGVDNNVIYQVTPDYASDDGLPIISVLTGGYPMRLTNSITCDEVMVTSSVGMASTIDATLKLETSDDYGLSWQDWGTLDLDTATPRTRVVWSSLGLITAPGRIFRLTDSGAARRINSLEMFSRDVEE